MADPTTVFVCITCRRGEEGLGPLEERTGFRFRAALQQAAGDAPIRVEGVECLLNCTKGCNIALRAERKWSYHFGDLDPASQVEDVIALARLHALSPDGEVPWSKRPEAIKRKAVSRIPPFPVPLSPKV